jgi:hypothetical protein
MKNLAYYQTYLDAVAKTQYHIYSHKKLTDSEALTAIKKKSLHTALGSQEILGHVGVYQNIKVVAADGWEQAE